ncbi:hypothetical protein IJH02_02080 [Candidatus Saccharibacteria bacterium]|nr:hypothetical protein [Candidatus Saccharibacteria bacterium]
MFFDDSEKIPELAKGTGFSIFVIEDEIKISNKKVVKTAKNQALSINLPKEATIEVEEINGKIRVDQIREIEERVKTKATSDQFIVVKNAGNMNEAAENAFLKLLEEPKENYHFVLFTKSPSDLLETVLSRGEIYILKQENPLDRPIMADEGSEELARKLIAADFNRLLAIAAEISDKKLHKNPREDAKKAAQVAIEILYKSYFKTKNPKFLKKLEKFLELYENLDRNGHIKLHLVADLC